jgi:hypothetical protein
MDAASGGRRITSLVGGGALDRFSSRLGRLSSVYLKDRLQGASQYLRIAGYFRSSIFELVNEEIETIGKVRIVCNSDLDPEDINAAKQAREQLLKEKWNDIDDAVESLQRRPRYRRLFEILKKGNVEVRVVARADAPFLHGKAGVIRKPDGAFTAFMGSLMKRVRGGPRTTNSSGRTVLRTALPGWSKNSSISGRGPSRCPTRSSRRSAAAPIASRYGCRI